MAARLKLLQITLTGDQSVVTGCKEGFPSSRRSNGRELEERNLHLMNKK